MRRRLPWLAALPLMAAGSLAAHALAYAVAGRGGGAIDAPEGAERSSSGLASHSVLALGVIAALVLVAAIAHGRAARGVSPWLFLLLPPLAFSFQELFERLLRAESAPFHAALEPRFLLGLLLQIPFGAAALLAARPLLRVVRRIARALARPLPVRAARRVPAFWLPSSCELPRIASLALGYPQRGPPAL